MSTDTPSFAFDPPPVADAIPATRSIGFFWRRFLAFFVDGSILGIIGFALGAVFFDTLLQLGPWGKLLGFLIAVPYFAVMESSVGGGQSLGKRLLHLRVVDAQGNTLPFEHSFARYTVFAVPFFLNKLALPVSKTPWVVFILLGVLVFGVGGATLYLLIFNRNTRQGLHDLAVGSYVVRAVDTGPVEAKPFWKPHQVIAGSLLILTLVGGVSIYKLKTMAFFPELLQDLQLVEQMDGVQQGGTFRTNTYKVGGLKDRSLQINVFWSQKVWSPADTADKVAKLILQHDEKVTTYDHLTILITHGYDIGIASGAVSQSFTGTPAEWHEHLFGASKTEGPTPSQQ